MSITVLQLHKRDSYTFKHIQDKYAVNTNAMIFALADGTTQSFNSELWAEMITKGFIINPTFKPNDLINIFTKQAEKYKSSTFEFSSNPAKASLEKAKQNKGGTATFIGLQFTSSNKIELISCGDSNLFLLNSDNKIIAFPFPDVDSLDANNYFINTEQLIQNKIDESFFKTKSIEYNSDDKIIIATDALSRLILKKPSILSEILEIDDFIQLKAFCLKYWESKELQEDDISAIIIPITNNSVVKIIEPPKDFSFPMEKEDEFIPTSLQQKKQRNYTVMEMNEIRNQFNGVAQDFHGIKKRLKLHEMLLMITISLSIVIILLMFFFRPSNEKIETTINKDNSENSIIQKYNATIDELKSEIKTMKNKLTDSSQVKEEVKGEKVENEKSILTISKEEAKKRQEELIKAGYKEIAADGIWGPQSEKTWNQYQQKKKDKK
jgi:serine/threonine protein phosphatase PrpC